MEKITIKGFGPIKYAEIEVKKLLVLIGEQASGKSTIAKLIYFFKSIPKEFYNPLFDSSEILFDGVKNPNLKIKLKFLNFFGRPKQDEEFQIIYQYGDERHLEISSSSDSSKSNLSVELSTSLFHDLISDQIRDQLGILSKLGESAESETDPDRRNAFRFEQVSNWAKMGEMINAIFCIKQDSNLFIIAGREPTVSYQTAFESYLKESLRKVLGLSTSQLGGQASDEILMLEFLEEVQRIKSIFQKYGGFGSLFELIPQDDTKNRFAEISERINSILKGTYSIDGVGEKLVHDNGFVYLRDASSGQKESIRIIQDLVLTMVEKRMAFRVIEEPEAHLFPVAQKQLIELLVFLANAQSENQVIITTHSPYVLSTFNNLLFATRVVDKNPSAEEEVAKVAPAPFRIDPATFAAYSLGNSFDAEEPYCANIVDSELGMIQQNYLDTVSDLLGMEFDHLSKIHLRSFQRHGR